MSSKSNTINISISGARHGGKTVVAKIIAAALKEAGYDAPLIICDSPVEVIEIKTVAEIVADAKERCPDFVLPDVIINEMYNNDPVLNKD